MEPQEVETIQVIAAGGVKVPMEHKPRDYITDEKPQTVADSTYYQRRIEDGDLKIYKEVSKKPSRAVADSTNGG
jgi:hypothetical protein